MSACTYAMPYDPTRDDREAGSPTSAAGPTVVDTSQLRILTEKATWLVYLQTIQPAAARTG
jgi:hypothetical protein